MFLLFVPIFVTLIFYFFYANLLKKVNGETLFCDLGFIYCSLLVLYTVIPGLVLVYGLTKPGDPIAVLLDNMSVTKTDLSIHLWRHFLFLFCFSVGYLFFRGKEKFKYVEIKRSMHFSIVFLMITIVVSLLILSLLSAPVETYYDNYIRYDHLSVPVRKIVSVLIRFKGGFCVILITLLFLNYKKYKFYILISVLLICVYELLYSHGSRINIFIILLQVFFLYSYFVKVLSVKKIFGYALILLTFFSIIEIIRLLDGNVVSTKEVISEDGIKPPGELGALFITSFHLYSEREKGVLPKREWQMFFYDIISPFTFNSDTSLNPMYWYANYYFPESIVPPFTIGPIAESAIWGGEIDLFFRGLINGAYFAFIVKWFLKRRDKWWGVATYAFLFSYSVITLKYSVFFYLTPVFKDLLPTLLLVAILIKLFKCNQNEILKKEVEN
ncbi:O-antigen polymerase [Flavobacterium sp.]|uniref:O-antigen polymerase n=1 Tax=Flavobacterium sp. TaxID=239 RepID=UPI0025C27E63|nr:O-antigen polymerase [Flavobacterium sp.]MBA4277227.1 hypothetical protein [Flavobacterium sp.]